MLMLILIDAHADAEVSHLGTIVNEDMCTDPSRITVDTFTGLGWRHVGESFQRLVVYDADLWR